MTDKRLDEIRAREAKATPGPWRRCMSLSVVTNQSHPLCEVSSPDQRLFEKEPGEVVAGEDADFIAHARQDIPWLRTQLELALKVVDAARGLNNHDGVEDYKEGLDPCIERQELTEALRAFDAANAAFADSDRREQKKEG